uniref:Stabilizer of axonemal microtubules 4 n=1 Tax=Latimeria chalumnae TaxID=7897 RepID=H3ACY0_LATCH
RMGRIPVGTTSSCIKASHGADTNPLKFYSTTYATNYGQEGFVPRSCPHSGAGYKSNYHPAIYYTPSLDKLDNPIMGILLRDNYSSITKKHFVPYRVPHGCEPFPRSAHFSGTGFMREKAISFPDSKVVKSIHYNTRDYGGKTYPGLETKHRALLYKLNCKDTMEMENLGHGSTFMSTEYKTKYNPKIPDVPVLLQHKIVGPKEESGFTEGSDLDPIIYYPLSPFRAALPGQCTDRPTGISTMKVDYVANEVPHGDEFLPVVANRSERGTGFTKQLADPIHTKVKKPTSGLHSITHLNYTGLQRPAATQLDLLERVNIGEKEISGYAFNNGKYVFPAKDPEMADRYLTNTNLRFFDKTPKGLDRAGWTRGGIQRQVPDGFVLNNKGLKMVDGELNTLKILRGLHPHVARTIKTQDRFYDDHTHDHKLHP